VVAVGLATLLFFIRIDIPVRDNPLSTYLCFYKVAREIDSDRQILTLKTKTYK